MLFKKLDELLRGNRPQAYHFLQQGLSRNKIEDLTISANLVFPEDLIRWYEWKNGERIEDVKLGEMWLFNGGMFFSLEEAIKIYKLKAVKAINWPDQMFPMFGDSVGDYFLVNLNTNSNAHGQISMYSLSIPEFDYLISYFDSLETALSTIIKWLEANVYPNDLTSNPENQVNLVDMYAIARELNPQSEFWLLTTPY